MSEVKEAEGTWSWNIINSVRGPLILRSPYLYFRLCHSCHLRDTTLSPSFHLLNLPENHPILEASGVRRRQ